PPGSPAHTARSPRAATPATGRRACRRSSTGCSPTPTARRSRSGSSRATPATRPRSPTPARSCRPGSGRRRRGPSATGPGSPPPAPIPAAVGSGRLRGADKIGYKLGRVIDKYKMAKHSHWTATDTSLTIERDQPRIDAEAALDGIYVIRTSVPADQLDPAAAV